MEVRKTKSHFIITNGPCALFCDRVDGSFKVGPVNLLGDIESAKCLGLVEGVLGKFQCHPKNPWCLLLIRESVPICVLHDGVEIRRIVRIAMLSLSSENTTDFEINPCPKHAESCGADNCEPSEVTAQPKIKNLIKNVADVVGLRGKQSSQKIRHRRSYSSQKIRPHRRSRVYRRHHNTIKHRLRYERQMLDEIEKLFQGDCDNFYYSPQGEDITNWTQRRVTAIQKSVHTEEGTFWQPLWRRMNVKVVWNNSLLADAIEKALHYLTELGLPPSHGGGQTLPPDAAAAVPTTDTEGEEDATWRPSAETMQSLASLTESLRALECMLLPVMNGFVECEALELRPNHMMGSILAQATIVGAPPAVKVEPAGQQQPAEKKEEVDLEAEELRMASSFKRLQTPLARKSVRARNVSNQHAGPDQTPSPTRQAGESEAVDNGVHRIRITLISRRAHTRAGCRFRRRGIDENGNVANYVETEQILEVLDGTNPHVTAFLQLRGSVPVFWSQSGIRYRPPINLEKTEAENNAAFTKHMTRTLQRFRRVIILNLVDSGLETQEYKLVQAYIRFLLLLNNPNLTYVGFDFHEYCRGLHFEHVSVLLNGLKEIIRNMKFCWLTNNGLLSKQDDVFRVNCVDCLDRTNLVQSVFGSLVIETQLRKLGLLSIDEDLPLMFHRMLQGLWANNGDALSRQYTGTVAMKGDFTRTGARTMNGLMRDGVSSVNRYYHRFGEIRRQAAIDFILGHTTSPELNFIQSCSLPEALAPTPGDAVMQPLLDQCRELCMLDNELSYFEFVVTSANQPNKPSRYLDTIGMITDKYLHLVRLTILQKPAFQPHVRIPVEAIYKIVVGVETRLLRAAVPVLQIFYKPPTQPSGNATDTELSSLDNAPVAEINAKLPETGLSPDEDLFGVKKPSGPQILYAPTMQMASANTPMHATILQYEVAEEAWENMDSCPARSPQQGAATAGFTDTEESDAARSAMSTTASEASRINTSRRGGQQSVAAEYYLAFRQPGVRLFNNTLIPLANDEEAVEALRAVADSLCIILKSTDHDVDLRVVLPPSRLVSPKRLNPPPQFCFPLDQESLQQNFSRLLPAGKGVGGILSSSRFWAVTETHLSVYDHDSQGSDTSFVSYHDQSVKPVEPVQVVQPVQLTETDSDKWHPPEANQPDKKARFRATLMNINTAIRSGINRMNIRPPRPADTDDEAGRSSQQDASADGTPETTDMSSSTSDVSRMNGLLVTPDTATNERETDDTDDNDRRQEEEGEGDFQPGRGVSGPGIQIVRTEVETMRPVRRPRVRSISDSSVYSLSENSALNGPNSKAVTATGARPAEVPAAGESEEGGLRPSLLKASLVEQTIPNLDSLRRDLLTQLIAEGRSVTAEGRRPVDSLLEQHKQSRANRQSRSVSLSCGTLFPGSAESDEAIGGTTDAPRLAKSKTPLINAAVGYLASVGLLFQWCPKRVVPSLDTADYAVGFVDGVVPSEEGRFRKAVVEQNESVSDYWHQMTLLSLQLIAADGRASETSGGDVTRESNGSVPTKNSDLASEGEAANASENKRPNMTNLDGAADDRQAPAEPGSQEIASTTTAETPQSSPQEAVLAQFKRFDHFNLPDIGLVNSPKLLEKLLKRQLENALEVEHQRHLMCPESQIQTDFIIF